MDLKETRVIRKPLELRAAKGDDGGDVFTGYVFAWDTESDDLGGFREIIRRGACQTAIAQPKNIFAILDHEKKVQNVLGDRDSGTLKLFEDEKGLGFLIQAGPTQAARDAAVVAGRNNIGVSFAFVCGAQTWSTKPDGSRLREITEFRELDDLSLVVDAAYKSSDVTVARRSLEAAIEAEKRSLTDPKSQIPRPKSEEEKAMEKRPTVEYLKRQLDQADIELRCYDGSGPVSERREEPTHDRFAYVAHRATERAMDAKRSSGAPSRALEINAAAAHTAAAESAKKENRTAAETFHQAAATMHNAAAGDDYAADYMTGRDCRSAAARAETVSERTEDTTRVPRPPRFHMAVFSSFRSAASYSA